MAEHTVDPSALPRSPDDVARVCVRVRDHVGTAILGKRHVIELALVCLLAEGHLLVEDVPGVGKTELAKALAAAIGGRFTRIQGTPDLLPTDVTGGQVYDRSTGALTFRPGPVFTDIVLVDELNRAAPKTQSALLEVMQERRVTVEDHTHTIPRPFFVIATMNPVGHIGTYDLPEAQLDRFMMAVPMGYPDCAAERDLVERRRHAVDVTLPAVVSHDELLAMTDVARDVFLSPSLVDYLVDLIEATRSHPDLERGASPRASLALAAAVRARAVASGRDHGVVDDVKALAAPVLSHRLVLSPAAVLAGRTARQVMVDLLADVPTPTSRRAAMLRR